MENSLKLDYAETTQGTHIVVFSHKGAEFSKQETSAYLESVGIVANLETSGTIVRNITIPVDDVLEKQLFARIVKLEQ
jgi:hypothetical protein